MVKNVIFAGVGGQGVILASKVLMEVAMESGFDVKESEVHGMAQRGGSVECNVRFGDKIYSPLIAKSGADFIVSFELLEAMRKLDYLAPGGKLIVNRLAIDPVPVTIGAMKYPADIEEWLGANVPGSLVVDTAGSLKEAGNKKVLNILMLGVLSRFLDFSEPSWHSAIGKLVKPEFVDLNRKAFDLGRGIATGR